MSRGALPTVIVGAKTLVREGVVKAIQTGHYRVQVYADMAGVESRSVCRSPALFILLLEETSAVHAAATVAAVRERFPRTRIVTLSIEADPEWSEPLFAAGANGCLPVRISPTTLLMVLDLLALNEDSLRLGTSVTRISEAITLQPSGCETPPPTIRKADLASDERLILLRREAVALNPRALSARESKVLLGIAKGESNKHVARRLGISESTVKTHVRSLLKKLSVANRTQAALWAANGFLESAAAADWNLQSESIYTPASQIPS